MQNLSRLIRFVPVLCVAATLLLSACGGGEPGSDESREPAQTSADDTSTRISGRYGPPPPDNFPPSKFIADLPGQSDGISTTVDRQYALAESTLRKPKPVLRQTQLAFPITNGLTVYVATDGNDAWSGLLVKANAARTDGPVRTIPAAQAVVRQQLAAMNSGSLRRPITVSMAAGLYRIAAPLTFTPADSGVPGSPVTYAAATAGTVIISGAVRLGSAVPVAMGDLVTMPAPTTDTTGMKGATQLFVNGRRATLARAPNSGNFWFVQKAIPLADEPAGQTGMEAFGPPADALTMINSLGSSDRARVIVNVMQSWTSGQHRISPLPAPVGGVRVAPRAPWAFLNFGIDQRFYIENVPAAFDAPGEWIWDGSTVHYLATAADAGQTAALEMPMLEKLVVIRGTESSSGWVADLQFRGLTFADTRQLTPDGGFADRQAATTIGAAIEVDAARRIVFDNCIVTRTGGYGIWFRNAVRDSQVVRSRLNDLGAGGIKLGLTVQAPTYAAGSGANTVQGNQIYDTGKLFPGAIGVWIGQSFDNLVANNAIMNTSYTAISLGWEWDQGTPKSGRNSVMSNLLYNIGQGQLCDIGAIYTLGESPGTVISGNVIREVRAYPVCTSGAWGLYNDEASSDVVMEKNIVVGTTTGGYLLHHGRRNTLRNNLLSAGDRAEVQVALSDPLNTKLDVNNNLLIPKVLSPLLWFATTPDAVYSSNVVSTSFLTAAPILTMCNGGCTTANVGLAVGTDPRLVTLTGATAETATWVAQTTSRVGPPGFNVATAPPVATTLPPVVVAPPVAFVVDIAGTAVGQRPANLQYRTGSNSGAISVIANTTAPAGKCLNFADMASNPNAWDPHSWGTLNHTSGTSTVEFSALIDTKTNYLHEWRDDATNYLTGPSLRLTATGIRVGGKLIGPLEVGRWTTFKVVAAVGANAGTWSLAVTPLGGVTTTYSNLALVSSNWKRLNWLGFVSDAVVVSNTCFGMIKATNPGN